MIININVNLCEYLSKITTKDFILQLHTYFKIRTINILSDIGLFYYITEYQSINYKLETTS